MKVALLSNINVDPIIRQLKREQNIDIYSSQGYGNELGTLINRESGLYKYKPRIAFIIIELMELLYHEIEMEKAETRIDEWFTLFQNAISDEIIYYVSDAYLHGIELDVVWDKSLKAKIESKWNSNLQHLMEKNSNVRVLRYSDCVKKIGENNAFSMKMWYMGKILHSTALQKGLSEEIKHCADIEDRTPKKVLLLDLDNTLWKGLAGENDVTPITLSDDGVGLVYKNFQRVIKQIKKQGVILAIVSKNNEEDALALIKNHPHMVLSLEDFAITKINWKNKAENIISIGKELNIGLDSMVFIDDSEVERGLIREAIPELYVPEFPDRPEELASFMVQLYRESFEKAILTNEDIEKTNQYRSNKEREKLKDVSVDFKGYLNSLEMKVYRVAPEKNKERLAQLINKTNQFNLTTKRITEQELSRILCDEKEEVFLYKVTDRFGDNGIVAVVIVEYGKEAAITEFTMSCRVMGRKIEDAIINDVEENARQRGYNRITGLYRPTQKNMPVKSLYESFGYDPKKEYDDGMIEYSLDLNKRLTRDIFVEMIEE